METIVPMAVRGMHRRQRRGPLLRAKELGDERRDRAADRETGHRHRRVAGGAPDVTEHQHRQLEAEGDQDQPRRGRHGHHPAQGAQESGAHPLGVVGNPGERGEDRERGCGEDQKEGG